MQLSNISVKYSEENSGGIPDRNWQSVVVGSDSFVTLTQSKGLHSTLRLRGSNWYKESVFSKKGALECPCNTVANYTIKAMHD